MKPNDNMMRAQRESHLLQVALTRAEHSRDAWRTVAVVGWVALLSVGAALILDWLL